MASRCQRPKRARHSLLSAPPRAQLIQQMRDVADGDLTDQARSDQRQQVPIEVVAVDLQRPLAPLIGSDPALLALKPPTRHGL